MIPAGVRIKKGEILNGDISLIANQSCYTAATINGLVNGDVKTIRDHGCEEDYPSNVHVFLGKHGKVMGNIYANVAVIYGYVKKDVHADHVFLVKGKVEGKIFPKYEIRKNYQLPPFLRMCEDPTATTLKKLDEKTLIL